MGSSTRQYTVLQNQQCSESDGDQSVAEEMRFFSEKRMDVQRKQ